MLSLDHEGMQVADKDNNADVVHLTGIVHRGWSRIRVEACKASRGATDEAKKLLSSNALVHLRVELGVESEKWASGQKRLLTAARPVRVDCSDSRAVEFLMKEWGALRHRLAAYNALEQERER